MPITLPAHVYVLVASGTSMDVLHHLYRANDFPMEIIVVETNTIKEQCESLHNAPNLMLIQNLKLEEPPRILIPDIIRSWFTSKTHDVTPQQLFFTPEKSYRSSHPP